MTRALSVRLYDAHVDRVFRLVYRMAGDMDRAQDYTQETFIKAFEKLREFRGESALSTWLGSIAISITLNGLRKVRRALDREVSLDDGMTAGRMDRSCGAGSERTIVASHRRLTGRIPGRVRHA